MCCVTYVWSRWLHHLRLRVQVFWPCYYCCVLYREKNAMKKKNSSQETENNKRAHQSQVRLAK